MMTQPTTDRILESISTVLDESVLPAIDDEPTRVTVEMIRQLLRGAAVRAAHEIAWMNDEIDAIRGLLGGSTDPAIVSGLEQLDALDTANLHLDHVQARYDAAGRVLATYIDAAFAAHDTAGIERARQLLQIRSEREMQIVGQLDLVGRG